MIEAAALQRVVFRIGNLGRIQRVVALVMMGDEFAQRLDRREDMPRVIREFIGFAGPAFLEVIIDPDAGVYPMVGPGQSYVNMITGDYIESREPPVKDVLDPSEMF